MRLVNRVGGDSESTRFDAFSIYAIAMTCAAGQAGPAISFPFTPTLNFLLLPLYFSRSKFVLTEPLSRNLSLYT